MKLLKKLFETSLSVVPIMIIVLVLSLTLCPLGTILNVRFIIGGILLILGLTVFLLGVDIGIITIGERSGAALTKKRNLPLLLFVSFVIGFLITIAEPDVQVLADQVQSVNNEVQKWPLIIMIASGVGLFVMLGLLRTVMQLPLSIFLAISYGILFIIAFFAPTEFIPVAFDSGGATTGPMTVPFIMALGVGVAAVSGGSHTNNKGNDDSFGLTGLASIGPILAVLIYGFITAKSSSTNVTTTVVNNVQSLNTVTESTKVLSGDFLSFFSIFGELLPEIISEVTLALIPLILLCIVLQITLLKLPPHQCLRVTIGIIYSFLGLVIFLIGVKGGFMPAGRQLGFLLASHKHTFLLCLIGLVFGGVVVCAEPAIWVLTKEVEEISNGTIKRQTLLIALCTGVAISIGLSMWRVIAGFSIWYFLIPGYVIALLMMPFTPKIFTAIAFDSGGVASGPMTSTFILSFTLGASSALGGNPVTDAFGVIALVAMTPLIAIQTVGLIFKYKTYQKKRSTKGVSE